MFCPCVFWDIYVCLPLPPLAPFFCFPFFFVVTTFSRAGPRVLLRVHPQVVEEGNEVSCLPQKVFNHFQNSTHGGVAPGAGSSIGEREMRHLRECTAVLYDLFIVVTFVAC